MGRTAGPAPPFHPPLPPFAAAPLGRAGDSALPPGPPPGSAAPSPKRAALGVCVCGVSVPPPPPPGFFWKGGEGGGCRGAPARLLPPAGPAGCRAEAAPHPRSSPPLSPPHPPGMCAALCSVRRCRGVFPGSALFIHSCFFFSSSPPPPLSLPLPFAALPAPTGGSRGPGGCLPPLSSIFIFFGGGGEERGGDATAASAKAPFSFSPFFVPIKEGMTFRGGPARFFRRRGFRTAISSPERMSPAGERGGFGVYVGRGELMFLERK